MCLASVKSKKHELEHNTNKYDTTGFIDLKLILSYESVP